ncbi:aldo/keto reductase [Spirosoma spitsbergense]|uniref:aldo/keto reductase n=1 Tax=Spirosoma spitsbergense TaxID=431554 RepID=UPI000381DDAB|nr:aldo/keto reductase [Spirosoma spitsbergense]
MRTVELTEGIKSSALGFGCAPILGSVDAKKARRAMDCAFDCGITHFDLARSYGYGEAEGFFGKVVKDRRDKVIIASKFGIQANWKAKILRPIKPIIRIIRSNSNQSNLQAKPVVVDSIAKVADHFHDRIPLRGNEMRVSLERSLRALNTDYLDYFFVHEPPESLSFIDELKDTAEKLKKEGKIRAWGLAYMRSQGALHSQYLRHFDVLQFDNSPGATGYKTVVEKRGLASNVLFSPLRGGSNNMTPAEKLKQLGMDFPKSVVLCSMFNEQHLIENASLFN